MTVSGGGTTAEPVHLTEIRNYLHLTVSQSFSSPFRPSFAVFACTSHESPCVMSSLIPPPLHAHIPHCIYLLSGPGSDSIFRVRAPGSDSFSRAPASSVLPLSSPRLRLLKTHAPFPPSPHFCILPLIEYSSLQFHFDIQQNDISPNIIIMC